MKVKFLWRTITVNVGKEMQWWRSRDVEPAMVEHKSKAVNTETWNLSEEENIEEIKNPTKLQQETGGAISLGLPRFVASENMLYWLGTMTCINEHLDRKHENQLTWFPRSPQFKLLCLILESNKSCTLWEEECKQSRRNESPQKYSACLPASSWVVSF